MVNLEGGTALPPPTTPPRKEKHLQRELVESLNVHKEKKLREKANAPSWFFPKMLNLKCVFEKNPLVSTNLSIAPLPVLLNEGMSK